MLLNYAIARRGVIFCAIAVLAACAQPERQAPRSKGGDVRQIEAAPRDRVEDTRWVQPGVTDVQKRKDVESCYYYANAQVRRDQQIDQDIQIGRSASELGGGMTRFQDQMDAYSAKKRLSRLYVECMRSLGYTEAQ